jgi:hypothetical protein
MSLLSSTFDTGSYLVTRSGGAGTSGADGHYTPAGTSTLKLIGSLQPLSGRVLRDLREGKRADDLRWFYTESPMYTVDEGHDQQDYMDVPDDSVPSTVRRFRVTKVEWFGVISGHYRVTLEKIPVP